MKNCPAEIPWVEINLDNLCYNYMVIRELVPDNTEIIPVIKDDAYGCGAVEAAFALEEAGVSFFAVARVSEAERLRSSGIKSHILVFGEVSDGCLERVSKQRIHLSVNNLSTIKRLKKSNFNILIHLNVDTGMMRLGISPADIEQALNMMKNSNISLKGIYTHYSCADEIKTDTVDKQASIFGEVLDKVIKAGLKPEFIHSSNSAAVITRRKFSMCNMVRPGIALYGCMPDPAVEYGIKLKQVVALKTHVVRVKKVSADTSVSYGGTYVTEKDTCIATVAAGYAHGVPRLLSNKGQVLIKGKKYRISGRITMDYVMVDIGNRTDIAEGDEAVIIGYQNGCCISADDVALKTGTIGYEILCGLNTGIERVFYKKGKIYKIKNHFN